MEKNKQTLLKILYAISFIAFLFAAFSIMKNNFLPLKIRMLFLGLLLGAYLVIGGLLYLRKNGFLLKTLMAIFLLLVGGASVIGGQYLNKSVSTIDKINEKEQEKTNKETVEFSLLVLKDSPLQKTLDAKDKEVMTALERDKSNIKALLEKFKEDKGFDLKLVDGKHYLEAGQKLLKKDTELMLLNESYRSFIEEAPELEGFSEKTRALERFTIEVEKNLEEERKLTAEEQAILDELNKDAKKKLAEKKKIRDAKTTGFSVYVSGIDSYGGLNVTGRSDVNIILSVNPKTKSIVTASVPRDSYVRIAGGGYDQYDKLTHSGIYGVDSSKTTLENLFGIPIKYYARVNFSSLIRMVDVLGGINIYNPEAFSAGGHYFPGGNIYLNGEQALAFSRHRYTLAGGDFARGKNQMRIIEGMLRKAMSPSILLNYQNVLDVLLNSTQTNMPSSEIIKLINSQIENGGEYSFESVAVEGYGQSGLPSYAMPGWNLYMMVPYQESIDFVADKLYLNMK